MRRRAPRGELYGLTSDSKRKLHAWFREESGTVPYHEIQRRLRQELGVRAGFSALSNYWQANAAEIFGGASSPVSSLAIVIRIEIQSDRASQIFVETIQSNEGMEAAR